MNSIGRMYPNLSASDLSNIILKGKLRYISFDPVQTPVRWTFHFYAIHMLKNNIVPFKIFRVFTYHTKFYPDSYVIALHSLMSSFTKDRRISFCTWCCFDNDLASLNQRQSSDFDAPKCNYNFPRDFFLFTLFLQCHVVVSILKWLKLCVIFHNMNPEWIVQAEWNVSRHNFTH